MTQEANAVTLYRIWNMVNFYNASLDVQPLDSADIRDSLLCYTLGELLALSKKLFTNSLVGHTTRLLERVESPPADLGPPQCFQVSILEPSKRRVITCLIEILVSFI